MLYHATNEAAPAVHGQRKRCWGLLGIALCIMVLCGEARAQTRKIIVIVGCECLPGNAIYIKVQVPKKSKYTDTTVSCGDFSKFPPEIQAEIALQVFTEKNCEEAIENKEKCSELAAGCCDESVRDAMRNGVRYRRDKYIATIREKGKSNASKAARESWTNAQNRLREFCRAGRASWCQEEFLRIEESIKGLDALIRDPKVPPEAKKRHEAALKDMLTRWWELTVDCPKIPAPCDEELLALIIKDISDKEKHVKAYKAELRAAEERAKTVSDNGKTSCGKVPGRDSFPDVLSRVDKEINEKKGKSDTRKERHPYKAGEVKLKPGVWECNDWVGCECRIHEDGTLEIDKMDDGRRSTGTCVFEWTVVGCKSPNPAVDKLCRQHEQGHIDQFEDVRDRWMEKEMTDRRFEDFIIPDSECPSDIAEMLNSEIYQNTRHIEKLKQLRDQIKAGCGRGKKSSNPSPTP